MISTTKTAIAAGVLALCGSTASAATIYASSVSGTLNGGTTVSCTVASRSTDRADVCNGLGAEDVDGSFLDGGFVSLGKFESLSFGFGTAFLAPVTVWEVTGNRSAGYIESLSIALSNSVSGATATGTLVNVDGTPDGPNRWRVVYDDDTTTVFDTLTFTDTSDLRNGTRDGFDIDAVSVNVVPLPAAGLLLLAGLGGMAAIGRRKSA